MSDFSERLHRLASFYAEHPDLPIPYELEEGKTMLCFVFNDHEAVFRSLGSFEKKYEDDGWFGAIKDVAGFKLKFTTQRENVCERKVVGKRIVPAKMIPAQPEKIIPEHEEEIVEWECRPVVARVPARAIDLEETAVEQRGD